jgi:arginyl-tRNA--protein-N-Asp/Glu arginylyltransferase
MCRDSEDLNDMDFDEMARETVPSRDESSDVQSEV